MRRKPNTRLSPDAVRDIVEQYEHSGLTRRQFSEQLGIHVGTLDYYRRRHHKTNRTRLIPVTVLPAVRPTAFTIVLGNGRKIESHWEFNEPALTRLVQLLERF